MPGTATAIIKRTFHIHDNNFSLIKAGSVINHQLNQRIHCFWLLTLFLFAYKAIRGFGS